MLEKYWDQETLWGGKPSGWGVRSEIWCGCGRGLLRWSLIKILSIFSSYFDENPMIYAVSKPFQQRNVFRNCCRLFHTPPCFQLVVGWLQMWPQRFTPPCILTLCNVTLQLLPLRNTICSPSLESGLCSCYTLASGMQQKQWCVNSELRAQSLSSEIVCTSTIACTSLPEDERPCGLGPSQPSRGSAPSQPPADHRCMGEPGQDELSRPRWADLLSWELIHGCSFKPLSCRVIYCTDLVW